MKIDFPLSSLFTSPFLFHAFEKNRFRLDLLVATSSFIQKVINVKQRNINHSFCHSPSPPFHGFQTLASSKCRLDVLVATLTFRLTEIYKLTCKGILSLVCRSPSLFRSFEILEASVFRLVGVFSFVQKVTYTRNWSLPLFFTVSFGI